MDTCFKTCLYKYVVSQNTQNSLSSSYALYFCQTSNRFTTKSSTWLYIKSRSSRKAIFSFTCCIMCHMVRTSNKEHNRVFQQYPTFNSDYFTHIHRGIIYRESDTHISWYLILSMIVVFSKISATIAPSVVPKSSKLLVI